MSTKVYEGYRIPASYRPEVLVRELEQAVAPLRRRLIIRSTAEALHGCFFGDWPGGGDYPEDGDYLDLHFIRAVDAEIKKRSESKQREDPMFSLEFSVAYLSDPGVKNPRHMYAIPFASRTEYLDLFRSMPWTEPYPYWNNTDEPDDVSRAEWRRRGKVWDRVLPDGPISSAAVVWESTLPSLMWEMLYRQDQMRNDIARELYRIELRHRRRRSEERTPESREEQAAWLKRLFPDNPVTVEQLAAKQAARDAKWGGFR